MEQSQGMEECLKLLKGQRDEQRLAGLLLATKFCKRDDHTSIVRVYEAIGSQFLDRLLKTGLGVVESNDEEAYLQLSITVIAAISRVPEIAQSKDMVSKIPYVLDVLKRGSGNLVINECYEFLFLDLLEDILVIEGEDEPSPFYSVCFMLPFLCQLTMEVEGCRILARNKGLKAVVDCLIKLIVPNSRADDKEYGIIFLACDTIMNVLLKKEETSVQLDDCSVVHLLTAFACWTEFVTQPSVTMMASSICSLIFESTSEEALLTHPDFKLRTMNNLSQLITRSLTACGHYSMSDDTEAEGDLYEIVTAGYSRWVHRFPRIKEAVKGEN
ncbi:neurochondrin family protein [Thalictrum thalictroides]|uniref:Neurochondrin family protein n=1 Tax=Thalictrum thalictroides TaxID=46969 RepID=A0A7J6X9A5_THATH|nr:neurochondrin family protein [Thalictrum thalictroides]